MKEKIIILGAGIMQGPAIEIAKELGFFTVVIDADSSAVNVGIADQFEQIDLKDKEGIETYARLLQKNGGLGGIMTLGTDFSATVAWVAERLGLPGLPYEAALNASDKARMRACFKKAGLPSPDFTVIQEPAWTKGLFPPFPLVIKPADSMGSRGCRRIDSPQEFREAAEDALHFSRSGRAIVEAFMPGPEFSIDAIVHHGEITVCGIADRHIFFPPYFIEMGHTMPTNIAAEQQTALLDTFCAGIRALGLAGRESTGAAKGDIKLSPQGPMIGEIAARLSGGYMSGWTYPYSSGASPVRAAILAAMGREPQGLVPRKTWNSAERAFISIPGKVKEIRGIEEARSEPHVRDLFLRITTGSAVNFPQNNVSKCGNVISAAPCRAEAAEAAEKAARSIRIRLEPANSETTAFLAEFSSFPPSAFQLSPEIQSALDLLPETVWHKNCSSPALLPFPEFTESGQKDFAGRSIEENLHAIRDLTGFLLPELSINTHNLADNKNSILGKSFWAAFIRGGYQGAVYYLDMRI